MPYTRYVDYEEPPVTEVVLGLQFDGKPIDLDALAQFAAEVRPLYPRREYHEPLVATSETFDSPELLRVPFNLGGGQGTLPRTWFVSLDGRKVVQLQSDRLVFNWRKQAPSDDYPRYEELRPEFDELVATLRRCVAEAGDVELTVNYAEVTYVNEVATPDSEPRGEHPPLGRVLRDFAPAASHKFLTSGPEDQMHRARYRIPHWEDTDVPAGRLYLAVNPAYRAGDQVPVYVLTLTANLVPPMLDAGAIDRALELGHEWVTRGFDDLLTVEMQAQWKKREGTVQ